MFENYWYIAAFSEDFNGNKTKSIKLLNQQILLIKDKSNQFFAIEDRCCHRNVQLSLGQVNDCSITCAYHGWEYNFDGECISIPSLEKNIPKVAKIKSYELINKFGVIWIFIGDKENANEDQIPDLFEMESNPFIFTAHTFDADLKFVSESLFDPYHINHVHKDSIKTFMGDLDATSVEFNIEHKNDRISGSYLRKNNGKFHEKIYFGKNDYIKTEFEFLFPNISKIKIFFEKRTLTIYEHIVEVEKNNISMIQLSIWENIFPKSKSFAKWFMKQISNKIVNEDIEFFKSHFRLKKTNSLNDVHIKSDEISIAFRKLWDQKSETNAK